VASGTHTTTTKGTTMPALLSGHTLVPIFGGAILEYSERNKKHVGSKIFPRVNSRKREGKIPVVPIEALTELPPTLRNDDGSFNESGWRVESLSFATEQHGFQERVPDEDVPYWQGHLDPIDFAISRVGGIIGRRVEKLRCDMAVDTGVFTSTNAGVLWATVATADPLLDVTTELEALEDNVGADPEEDVIMVMSIRTLRVLNRSTAIADRIKFTHSGMQRPYSKELLAELFGVSRIEVARGRYNTADQGLAASLSDIWDDDYVWIGLAADAPDDLGSDPLQPSAGYSFLWSEMMEDDGGEDYPIMTTMFRDDDREGQIVRGKTWIGVKTANASAGRLLRVKGF